MGISGSKLIMGFLGFSVLFFIVVVLLFVKSKFSDEDAADSNCGEKLRLVSTVWPPFTNEHSPRFANELVTKVLRHTECITDMVIVDEYEFTESLLSGEFYGSPGVWKDAEDEHDLMYSKHYFLNELLLVGRRGSDVSADSLADLVGQRIALVAGKMYGEEVKATPGLTIVRSTGVEDSIEKLRNGEADYTLIDRWVIQYIIRNEEEAQTQLAIGRTPLLTRSLHFAISRSHPKAELIINGFNDSLHDMFVDRSYHDLLRLNWLEAGLNTDSLDDIVLDKDRASPSPPELSSRDSVLKEMIIPDLDWSQD